MGMLILVILCVMLVVIAIDFSFSIKKTTIYNNMDSIYIELENYIIKNGIKVDNNLAKYLYNIKLLKNNKELTDVRVMIMLLKSVPVRELKQSRAEIKRIDKLVPERVVELGNKFFYEATKSTRLSRWSPRFLLFLLVKTLAVLATNLLQRSYNNITNYFRIVRKVLVSTFDLERVVSYRESALAG